MTMKKTKQQQQKAPNIYHEVRNYVKTLSKMIRSYNGNSPGS